MKYEELKPKFLRRGLFNQQEADLYLRSGCMIHITDAERTHSHNIQVYDQKGKEIEAIGGLFIKEEIMGVLNAFIAKYENASYEDIWPQDYIIS